MFFNRIFLLTLSFSLLACSSNNLPKHYHEIHAMKGSMPFRGEPLKVEVRQDRPLRLSFPEPVRVARRRPGTELLLDKRYDSVLVQATENFSKEGEPIHIRLWSGLQYELWAKLGNEEAKKEIEMEVETPRASFHRLPRPKPLPLVKKYVPEEAQELLRKMITAAGEDISGYEKLHSYSGQVLINSRKLRGIVDTFYLGPDLKGYVVTLKNMTDRPVVFGKDLFKYEGVQEVWFDKNELGPRPSQLVDEPKSIPHEKRIYIVTDTRGLGRKKESS